MTQTTLFDEATNDEATNSDKKRSCPLCGGGGQVVLEKLSLEDWRIVNCDACNFVYLANPVSYEALVHEHAWERNSVKEDDRRSKDRPTLDNIGKATRFRLGLFRKDKSKLFLDIFKQGRIVDVGCGSGISLPRPLQPYGIEISRDLAKHADEAMKKRGGRCIHASAIEGLKECEDEYFDGVLLRSFLEHETNPLVLLQEAHRVLKSSGVTYVRVPNYASLNRLLMGQKWCGFRYPDHVNYFTPSTLAEMCRKSGFKMKLLNPLTIWTDDNIKAVLSKA